MTSKISSLPGAAALTGVEVFPGVQSGGTVGVSALQLRAFILPPVNVKDAVYGGGAKGDGTTDDTVAIQAAIDAAFGTAGSPHAITNAVQNRVLFFPPGKYKITASLVIPPVYGAIIAGSGRGTTWINCTVSTTALKTNGMGYCSVSSIRITSAAGGTCFDLNWDGSSPVSTQSNTFSDMLFENGAFGVNIGAGGFQASENLFSNCFWASQTTAGIKVFNYNALQNTIEGGNFQNCAVGCLIDQGSITGIYSVGFQGSTTQDIIVNNSANDSMVISGCRTESTSFVRLHNGMHAVIQGCGQTSSSSGFFCRTDTCPVSIEGCVSINGQIVADGTTPRASIRASSFGRTDWIAYSGLVSPALFEIENVVYGGTPNGSGAGTPTMLNRQRIDASGTHSYTVS